MKFRYSNEDVKNIHRLFMSGIKKHFDAMPQYFKDEINAFDRLYFEFTDSITDKEGVKNDVIDSIKEKNEWIENVYKKVKLLYYSVKGTDNKKIMSDYFGTKTLSDIVSFEDLLNVSEQVKIISKHESIKHLDEIVDEIAQLYKDGLNISENLKSNKNLSTEEVKSTTDKKNDFAEKYMKLKYLLKGYFYGTEVNLKDILWD